MSLNVCVIMLLQLLNEQIHPLDIVIAAVEKLQADLTDNVDASVNLLEHSCISCTGLQVTIISILTLLLDYLLTINSHTNVNLISSYTSWNMMYQLSKTNRRGRK